MNIINFLSKKYVDINQELLNNTIWGKKFIYINPLNYLYLRKNESILDGIYYRMDGMFFIYFVRVLLLRKKRVVRQSFDFSGFAFTLLDFLSKSEATIFIAGGSRSDVEIFTEKIISSYPRLNIIGTMDGYNNEDDIIDAIYRVNPQFVILGLGNLKQERVASALAHSMRDLTLMTCGAFISQTARSNNLNYYPKLINYFNLRWLYRFINEPHTIKRVFFAYPFASLVFICDYLKFILNANK